MEESSPLGSASAPQMRFGKIDDLVSRVAVGKGLGATGHDYGDVSGTRTMADILRRRRDRWNLLFVAGMWFQRSWALAPVTEKEMVLWLFQKD